jgi:hypothetical protein
MSCGNACDAYDQRRHLYGHPIYNMTSENINRNLGGRVE